MKILVVEDDSTVAQTLKFLLSSYSYAVDVAADGEAGLQMAEAFEYDLLLLDVMLPKLDGISLCQKLRAYGLQLPILLLTGQGGGQQKAIALNAGADDYVVKPFDPEELIARVQALLRRGGPTSQPILSWGSLTVDPSCRRVTYGPHLLSITPKEYGILELLLRNPQKSFSPKAILDHVWSSIECPGEEAVRVHIKELRQKLTAVGAPKDLIKTVHRVGYRLNPIYSSFLATQSEQQLSTTQIAELKSVNEELRATLEQLQVTQEALCQKNQELEIAYQTIEQERRQLQAAHDQLEIRVAERTAELMQANRSLQQQQYQWQALFDHALDAMVIADDTGRYVDVNPAACELFGVSKAELLCSSIANFAEPELDFVQTWQYFLQQGQMLGEFCLHRPDGTTRQTEFAAIANFIPGHHLSILRDVSDRRQAEAALRESERRLSTLMNNLPGYVYRVNNDLDYTPQFISEGVLSITGYRQEDYLVNRTISCGQEIHPDDVEWVWNLVQQAVEAHQPYECEYRIITKAGDQKWVWERGQGIYAVDGSLCFLEGFVTDISERKRAEEALRESEQNYHQILDSIVDIVVVKQPGSRLVWGNKAFRDYYGMTLDELQGIVDAPFNQPDYTLQYMHDDAVVFATGQTLEIPEERVTRHDGVVRIFSTIKAPIYDESGGVVMLVGVCRDITDRKQAEFEQQQQILREQLIAEISQDIRQSLDLKEVLSRTVEQVRQLLNTDRVVIFRFRPDWQGDVIMESVGADWTSLLDTTISDPCFRDRYVESYRQGRIAALYDIDREDLQPCHVELLKQFQVRANLVVPILQGEKLWGLLVAHHCSGPRHWQASEVDLLRQLATQVGIAIQQSELYQQTRRELLERERMQIVLEESEERFRSLSAAAPIGICQTNADGICIYTNAYWQEMSGLSFGDSLGNGWLQAVHPDDRKMLFAAWDSFVQGKTEHLPEFRLLTPQEEVCWVSARVAVMKSATGEIIGYVSLNEDITERKLAERKIREQAALLDIASDAIFVRDLGNRILYWNQGAERLYGWQSVEAVGQLAHELLQEDASQLSEIMQALLDRGEWQGEIRKITKDGREVIVAGRWTLGQDEAGQPKFILSVGTDITEKKQLEAQFYRAQRLESLGTLASGIAHDLNNVLTPVLAISQLLRLQQFTANARSQEMLKVLEESAKQGANMVKQILTFARGTNGECVPLQVNTLVREVIKVIRQTFPKSIAVRQDIPDQPLWLVCADPTHLHQVLLNLCVNARDAMPDGGTLTLSAKNCCVDRAFTQTHLDAQVGNYVVVTIADTGTGIPLDVRDRIFEPFFTTKQPGQGTGLGLSTVMGIVKSYGGFVQVFSELGQGTQFEVYLPATEATLTPEEIPVALLQGNGELVLVVDDDPVVQQTNRSLLESYRYRTLVANDGAEAITLYTKHQAEIDLILMDIMMPNMDGITAVRTLKRINPQVKIISISGLSSHRDAALAAGSGIFLAKPYVLEDLLQSVSDLLQDGNR